MLTINNQLSLAITASLKAGAKIMEVYEQGFEVEIKEDNSPLTEADKQSSEIINDLLASTDIPVIGEEIAQLSYAERKNWKSCWIVDPLDGTKEFIKRNGEFTVNIALANKGVPVLGVIYVPVPKTLYFADVNEKEAYKVQLDDHTTSIETILKKAERLKPEQGESMIKVVGSRSHMSEETLDFVEELRTEGKTVEIVSKGSSLKFCLVAEGNAQVYPRFAPTMEWDTAAGQAICNAVGVEVISNETNAPLKYNKEKLLNPWFVVRA